MSADAPARLEESEWHTRRDVGLRLLQTLASFYPEAFRSEEVLAKLPDMLEGANEMLGLDFVAAAALPLPLLTHPQLTRRSRFSPSRARASTPSSR